MVNFVLVTALAASLAPQERALDTRAVCPAVPSCPIDNGCTATTANGAAFTVACSTDLYGGDLETVQVDTYQDCLTACSVTQGCVAASYKSRFCYLKRTITNAPVTNTLVTAARISGTPKATPTATNRVASTGTITCPNFDNTLYSAPRNSGLRQKVFVIACSRDFYGGDLRNQPAADMATCLDTCALNGSCIGVSYVAASKLCYLKSAIGPALYNTKVIGAYITSQ